FSLIYRFHSGQTINSCTREQAQHQGFCLILLMMGQYQNFIDLQMLCISLITSLTSLKLKISTQDLNRLDDAGNMPLLTLLLDESSPPCTHVLQLMIHINGTHFYGTEKKHQMQQQHRIYATTASD